MRLLKPSEHQGGCKKTFEPYLTISAVDMYFSAPLCRKFNLQAFDHLYFVNEGNWWGFYKTKNKDGYVLRPSRGALRLGHSTLRRDIRQSLRLEGTQSFVVRGSQTKEVAGEVLYEIITTKRVEKLHEKKNEKIKNHEY